MKKILYYVQKPCRRVISSINPNTLINPRLEYKNYFLSFPHCVFKIEYDHDEKNKKFNLIELNFFLSNGKKLYIPPILNSSSGRICCPKNIKGNKKHKSLKDFLNFIVSGFWSSKFSDDIECDIIDYEDSNKKIVDYDYWQRKTKKEPNWIPSYRCLVEYLYDDEFQKAIKDINENGLDYISYNRE